MMDTHAVEEAISSGNLFMKFAEKYPHTSIFASISGFGTTLLAALKIISVVFGAAGAVFGCVAGYYSLRIMKRRWDALNK